MNHKLVQLIFNVMAKRYSDHGWLRGNINAQCWRELENAFIGDWEQNIRLWGARWFLNSSGHADRRALTADGLQLMGYIAGLVNVHVKDEQAKQAIIDDVRRMLSE